MSAGDDILAFQERVLARHSVIVRRLAVDLLRRIVMRTPVDTGRLRGNWQASVGAPAGGVVDNPDPDGSGTIAAAASTLAGVPLGETIYLTNNLPYARRIEYEGWSKQAPAGMVRVSIAEVESAFRVAVDEADSGGGD